MASGNRIMKPSTVHFSSVVEQIEFNIDQKKRLRRLVREKKPGYLVEASLVPNGGDAAGEEEWIYYHSALKMRMRRAERRLDKVNQQHARWRANRLRRGIDDPDDESHLGIVSRKGVNKPGETVRSPSARSQAKADDAPSSSSTGEGHYAAKHIDRASSMCRPWKSILSAVKRATSKFVRHRSVDEVVSQDHSAASPESTRGKRAGPATNGRRNPVVQCMNGSRSKVHPSFESIVCCTAHRTCRTSGENNKSMTAARIKSERQMAYVLIC
eukprot:TRINITY_DN6440_c1_g2_i1.p1 TRINITY_DN6440_c1_g2~~TRINITY_DN6440_c1_g2_i1.p1  ORF type:complete len:270 (-),score=33.32 TRINITY_DN6440_c1_g2_i1:472-1281(-)